MSNLILFEEEHQEFRFSALDDALKLTSLIKYHVTKYFIRDSFYQLNHFRQNWQWTSSYGSLQLVNIKDYMLNPYYLDEKKFKGSNSYVEMAISQVFSKLIIVENVNTYEKPENIQVINKTNKKILLTRNPFKSDSDPELEQKGN